MATRTMAVTDTDVASEPAAAVLVATAPDTGAPSWYRVTVTAPAAVGRVCYVHGDKVVPAFVQRYAAAGRGKVNNGRAATGVAEASCYGSERKRAAGGDGLRVGVDGVKSSLAHICLLSYKRAGLLPRPCSSAKQGPYVKLDAVLAAAA